MMIKMMINDEDDGFSLKWWISQVSRVYSIHPILDHACHDDDDGNQLMMIKMMIDDE